MSLLEQIILVFTALAALAFFLSSYGYAISFTFLWSNFFQGVLIVLAFCVVAFLLESRQIKKDRFRKKRMLAVLKRKKDILKTRFDAKNNLSAKSEQSSLPDFTSSTNFAKEFQSSEAKVPSVSEADPIENEKDLPDQYSFENEVFDSQINLARIFIEGEDISEFNSEWRNFFAENEGKEPIDKLNNMLKNNQ